MTVMKAKKVINGLEKKGFRRSEGDHAHLILYCNGKETSIRTKVSHGSKEIDDHLISKMSVQVKLDKKKFVDLINCPLTTGDYLKELKTQGFCLE